jgi:hypothetical protein
MRPLPIRLVVIVSENTCIVQEHIEIAVEEQKGSL